MGPNNGEVKSFYKVTAMSAAFRVFDEKLDAILKECMEKAADPEARQYVIKLQMDVWRLRIEMTQAQQLTMISESLKEIAAKFIA